MSVSIPLLATVAAWADESEDRAAVGRVITALQEGSTARKQDLFTADAQNELDRFSGLDRCLSNESDNPLTEVAGPGISLKSVRFITKNVALVDAINTQNGSVVLGRRVPVLFVMRRQAEGWRIASVRVMVGLRDVA